MTDAADRADDEIEHETAEALRMRRPPGPPAIGACHYCAEPLPPGLRWCDRECEAGWEYEIDRKAQNRIDE